MLARHATMMLCDTSMYIVPLITFAASVCPRQSTVFASSDEVVTLTPMDGVNPIARPIAFRI